MYFQTMEDIMNIIKSKDEQIKKLDIEQKILLLEKKIIKDKIKLYDILYILNL